MSYGLGPTDAVTGQYLVLDQPHHMRGGTYPIGGSHTAELNITYNYSNHFYRVMGDGGIRTLYGKTGAETIPILEAAIRQLGDDQDPDYWKSTEGNAKQSLFQCLALARMRPDGVWKGD